MNFKKVKEYMQNPYKVFLLLAKRGLFDNMDDQRYLELMFRARMGKKLNLKRPQTFNEKMQWLKLYNRNQKYPHLVDKCEVKTIVANIIGEEFIIPTLGVWDKFDDINFDVLPNQFVLKTTHDSGGVVICKNKKEFNINSAREKIERSLRHNYYKWAREWPYRHVIPRIIAEQYLENSEGVLVDYKIFNYNGEPKQILVCKDRYKESGMTEDFFDLAWKHLDLKRAKHDNSKIQIEKPENFQKMIELARILSKEMCFLRTDFYEVAGRLYFGELTFYPASGFERFVPDKWDKIMGEWIKIPNGIKKDE